MISRDASKKARPRSTFGQNNYVIESGLLKKNRMYVTCQSDEDLAYILKYSGEDNLIMGSDYTHKDQSMDHDFARLLRNGRRTATFRNPP